LELIEPKSGSTQMKLRFLSATLSIVLLAPVGAATATAQPVTRTIDTSDSWVFVSLSAPEGVVEVGDPGASSEWDIAFFGTDVMLNGGDRGPGGVTAHCLCHNRAATADEIQYMTADGELPVFDRVGAIDLPAAADAWHPAAFAIDPWYRYNLRDEHFIWPLYHVYLVRRDDVVHKLQIVGYYGRTGEPRQITFRHEKIPA
jgi:hypothetical protein